MNQENLISRIIAKIHKYKLRKLVQPLIILITVILIYLAVRHIRLHQAILSIEHANILLLALAMLAMASSMWVRAVSWFLVLKRAFVKSFSLSESFNAIAVGVFLSATSPLRLGEVARVIVLARHAKASVKTIPRIAGTILSQTLMNILALAILGVSLFVVASTHLDSKALVRAGVTTGVLILIAIITVLIGLRQKRLEFLRDSFKHFVSGFSVFKYPSTAVLATIVQLLAWVLQAVSCYALLIALHIHTGKDVYAAAAILFAVNVTAVVPLTPANVGPFQAACVAVLSGLLGVNYSVAIAYGILLQLVEVFTAILLGVYGLHQEGMSRRSLISESMNKRV